MIGVGNYYGAQDASNMQFGNSYASSVPQEQASKGHSLSIQPYVCREKDDTGIKVAALGTAAISVGALVLLAKGKGKDGKKLFDIFKSTSKSVESEAASTKDKKGLFSFFGDLFKKAKTAKATAPAAESIIKPAIEPIVEPIINPVVASNDAINIVNGKVPFSEKFAVNKSALKYDNTRAFVKPAIENPVESIKPEIIFPPKVEVPEQEIVDITHLQKPEIKGFLPENTLSYQINKALLERVRNYSPPPIKAAETAVFVKPAEPPVIIKGLLPQKTQSAIDAINASEARRLAKYENNVARNLAKNPQITSEGHYIELPG